MQLKQLDPIRIKLNAYAASAVCFLIHHQEATAQVVYTDIDPDIVLDEALESAALDIDGNGTIDFVFLNSSFTYYNESWFSYRTRQDIFVELNTSQNALVGVSFYFNTGYGAFTWYYPIAINNSYLIGEDLEWQNNSQQILAIRTLKEDGGIVNIGGYWYPEVLNKFLAIRFINMLDQEHYGWIRCDVKDEGRTLIIKDYAYEMEPGKPILAGDTLYVVGINENANTLNANIYSFGFNVYINNPQFNETEVTIYDLSGKALIHQKLENAFTTINMVNYLPGMFIINLKNGNEEMSQSVVIR